MMGNKFKQGWPNEDDYDSPGGGGGGDGGISPEERLYRFRFKIGKPAENTRERNKPITKRVLIMDSVPCCLHEHDHYSIRSKLRNQGNRFTSLCLAKNSFDERGCPLCDELEAWASFVGFFSVIDMGEVEYLKGGNITLHHRFWESDKGEKHYVPFERVLMAAKAGSRSKPGVLKTLQWQAERRGEDLSGTVWDTTRTGDKTAKVGDNWEYVERIDMADAAEYLKRFGAQDDDLVDDDGNSTLQVADYKDVFIPMSFEDMNDMIFGSSSKRSGGRVEGAGFDGNRDSERVPGPGYQDTGGVEEDDDIPF